MTEKSAIACRWFMTMTIAKILSADFSLSVHGPEQYPRVLVVGLETPAPTETLWLQELSRRTRVVHLQVRGDGQNVREAVSLPDPRQEVEWVADRLVELAQGNGLPLHRLAVTAPDIATYAPQLQRVLA